MECTLQKLEPLYKVLKGKIFMTNKKKSNTYQIEIIETMSAIIEIVAKDDFSAILQARERYRNEDIELNYDDLIDTKFNIFDRK